MLNDWIAVGIGGMLGSIARYGIMLIFSLIGPTWLPYATLTVNILGCLAIGFVSQWALHQTLNDHWWVLGVRVGLLGGLTTFSSFGLDVIREWQAGRNGFSVALIAMHCLAGISAVALGIALAKQQD